MAGTRAERRERVSAGALLTLGQAAELLPIADGEARRWLIERRLVRYLLGRPVVRWADVLAELGPDPESRSDRAPHSLIPRFPL